MWLVSEGDRSWSQPGITDINKLCGRELNDLAEINTQHEQR